MQRCPDGTIEAYVSCHLYTSISVVIACKQRPTTTAPKEDPLSRLIISIAINHHFPDCGRRQTDKHLTMRACLILVVALFAVLILAESGEARIGRKQRDTETEVQDPARDEAQGGGHHRGNKERKDRKGGKARGRHHGNGGDEMMNFDEITQANNEEPEAEPVDVEEVAHEEREPEMTPHEDGDGPAHRRGKKKGRRGNNENTEEGGHMRKGGAGKSAKKEARKESRQEARREKQAGREAKQTRWEEKMARKEARKEARGEMNEGTKEERKQAKKEAKKLARMNMTSNCEEHSDCQAGSCCQQRGAIRVCRAFDRGVDKFCFNDCTCAEGLECYISEERRARRPGAELKGQCQLRTAETADQMPAAETTETAEEQEDDHDNDE